MTGDWRAKRGFLEVGHILLLDLGAGYMHVLSFGKSLQPYLGMCAFLQVCSTSL